MLKKIFAVFALFVAVVMPAHAELKVDIVAGALEPTSIAVQKFETGKGVVDADAKMIREVVEADLKRTGLFRIVSHDAFPEYVKMGEMPNFKSWMAIKTQVLVQARMNVEDANKYKLEFFVWDINGTEQIEAQSLVASTHYGGRDL